MDHPQPRGAVRPSAAVAPLVASPGSRTWRTHGFFSPGRGPAFRRWLIFTHPPGCFIGGATVRPACGTTAPPPHKRSLWGPRSVGRCGRGFDCRQRVPALLRAPPCCRDRTDSPLSGRAGSLSDSLFLPLCPPFLFPPSEIFFLPTAIGCIFGGRGVITASNSFLWTYSDSHGGSAAVCRVVCRRPHVWRVSCNG